MSNQLTPDQEENLLRDFDKDAPISRLAKGSIYNPNEVLAFARLYHTEASKTAVSGEVRSAEEMLSEFQHGEDEATGIEVVAFSDALEAMREYAAQFESKWLPIDSAPKDKHIRLLLSHGRECIGVYTKRDFVGEGWFQVYVASHGTGIGHDTFLRFPEEQPTHWQPLPPPQKKI